MRYPTILPKSNGHHKIPMKTKIPTAVFQCTFLGEFVFLTTALTAFNVRRCLVSKPHQASDQLAKKASLFEIFLERVGPTRTNASITIHRKPSKNISNPAMCHYISELTPQLFDAGIARIQPRVSFCFRISIDRSANASRHVTRLYKSRVKLLRMFLPGRHVVS